MPSIHTVRPVPLLDGQFLVSSHALSGRVAPNLVLKSRK